VVGGGGSAGRVLELSPPHRVYRMLHVEAQGGAAVVWPARAAGGPGFTNQDGGGALGCLSEQSCICVRSEW
jgi:hypothetical protein